MDGTRIETKGRFDTWKAARALKRNPQGTTKGPI